MVKCWWSFMNFFLVDWIGKIIRKKIARLSWEAICVICAKLGGKCMKIEEAYIGWERVRENRFFSNYFINSTLNPSLFQRPICESKIRTPTCQEEQLFIQQINAVSGKCLFFLVHLCIFLFNCGVLAYSWLYSYIAHCIQRFKILLSYRI